MNEYEYEKAIKRFEEKYHDEDLSIVLITVALLICNRRRIYNKREDIFRVIEETIEEIDQLTLNSLITYYGNVDKIFLQLTASYIDHVMLYITLQGWLFCYNLQNITYIKNRISRRYQSYILFNNTLRSISRGIIHNIIVTSPMGFITTDSNVISDQLDLDEISHIYKPIYLRGEDNPFHGYYIFDPSYYHLSIMMTSDGSFYGTRRDKNAIKFRINV